MVARHSISIRVVNPAVLVAALLLLTPARAVAQTAADLFAGQSVDEVWVHINSRDWQLLKAQYQLNTFYPCDVQWRNVRVYNAGCRSRGSGSRNGTKPGLDIQFDRYVSGQRFLGLSNLILDNMWQDPSMLQERLTMWAFQQVGVAASREAAVKLFVGGDRQFVGVYNVVEVVDSTFLQRAFNTPDAYLYEYRWVDVYNFENLGNELEPYAARFAARTHENESTFALYAPIRDLIALMNDAPLDRIGEALDLQALVSQLAVENYVSDSDGLLGNWGLNNFYLARTPGAATRVIPWDKDAEFVDFTLLPRHNFEYNVLATKIWEDSAAQRQYLQVLLNLSELGPALQDEFEREAAQIVEFAHADMLKIPTNPEFDAAVDQVRAFLRDRPAIVRFYVNQLAPDLAPQPVPGVSGSSPSRNRRSR